MEIDASYISGLFALGGVLIGGFFTLRAAKLGHDWDSARRHIARLSEQAAAYHALEQEYAHALHEADPGMGAPQHIKTLMRDRVQQLDGFERPTLTGRDAREIAKRYS